MQQIVGAMIVSKQQILLGKRSATRAVYPGIWDIFGGHMEAGESPEQTLQRELAEELGITITEWRYIETLHEPGGSKYGKIEYHWYLVTGWDGTPINVQPEEHDYIQWFSLEDALRLDFLDPAYYRLLRDAMTL
jgi:8-oxo-dGTP diphosphatase